MKYAPLIALLALISIVFAQTSMEVPAVDVEGNGLLSTLSVEATPGNGDIFISITPLTGVDTQHSEKTALALAAKKAGVDAKKFDVLFKIESTVEEVDGPSAGAALALLSYAELSGKRMRRDITITGSIDSQGHIGKIGGILEKATAVGNSELRRYAVFMIPRKQRIQGGIDVAKLAMDKWKLQVVEVDNIDDVLKIAFETKEGEKVTVEEKIIPPLVLIPFKASEKTSEFGKIAISELSETKRKAGNGNLPEELSAQAKENVKEAQQLFDKNYYYSAANIAFITTISIDEFTFVNQTKPELLGRLKELKAIAKDMVFENQTEENFEMIVGAKLRFYWAKGKIALAQDKIAAGNYMSAAGDIALATSWMRAAGRMNIPSKNPSAKPVRNYYFREKAADLISKAKELRVNGRLDFEADERLKTAIDEFSEAEYLTAVFDASFAIAYSEALDNIVDKTYAEVVQNICNKDSFEVTCDIFKDKEFASMWAEMYYAHALYNFQESNRSFDGENLANGMKLLSLSSAFEKRRAEVLAISGNPGKEEILPPQSAILPSKQVQVKVSVEEDSKRNLILYSIVAILVLIVLYAYVSRRPKDLKMAYTETQMQIERAEELLLQGKISDKSFEYFRNKYGDAKKKETGRKKKN